MEGSASMGDLVMVVKVRCCENTIVSFKSKSKGECSKACTKTAHVWMSFRPWLKIDADYNDSVNVRSRRSIPQINIYTPYRQVKEILATADSIMTISAGLALDTSVPWNRPRHCIESIEFCASINNRSRMDFLLGVRFTKRK